MNPHTNKVPKHVKIDEDKIEEATLALLYITSFKDSHTDMAWRTWKGHDREVMERLYQKGYISNPESESRSVSFSKKGFKKAEKLFSKYFKKKEDRKVVKNKISHD